MALVPEKVMRKLKNFGRNRLQLRRRTVLLTIAALVTFVAASCIASEVSWANKKNAFDPTRELVGLPSVAIGNLSPASRNPGLEILCTGLYDTPGGYCAYFTNGVPFTGFPFGGNITVVTDGP